MEFLCWSVYLKFIILSILVSPNIEFGQEYFEGVSIKAGENIRLKVTIKGRPTPKVTWYRDNIELTKKMVDITTISGSSTLFIRDADRSHRGLYTVEAINPSGSKKESVKVEVFEPTEVPDAPSIVNVTDTTNTSVSLEWTRPAHDGGMEIHGYIIEMCKGSEAEWHRVNEDLCAVTRYSVTGLETGAEYKFRICAVNSVGKGEAKEMPEFAQAVDRLLAPEIDIDASFKQTHIVKSGGSVCIHIGFKGKPTPTASWTKVDGELGVMTDITTTETFTALTLENCTRNDTGKYTLTLENSSGNKSITVAVKVLDTPGVPGALSIKEVTRGALTIAWEPPTNDGGARVHHYTVEKREASRRTWTEAAPKTTQTSLRVSDLLEGVPYFFRVMAENQYGLGEAYEMPDPVIATAEPAPPKRVDIIDTTDTSATLAWLKPEHDGGSRITGYCVEAKGKDADKWVVCGTTKNLSLVIEGLTENSEYEFRVKAKNDSGFSVPREAFSSVIIKEPRIEPTADLSGITNQLITSRIGESFEIDVPISGRPAPKVSWKLEEMRLKETDRVSIKTNKNRTTLTVKDCMRGDGGRYFLTLENVTGSKTFTVTVNVIGRPSPPEGPIEISSITSESCVLSWNPPEDDGGTDITNYIIEKRESGCTAWQLINSSVKHTSFHVSHLTKYMQYTFRICAENRFGVSKPTESETIVAEHPFGIPEVFAVTANSMSIRWEEPYHDGGSKVSGYWIEKKERNTILWVRENKIPCFECYYKVEGLVEGEEYEFRVIAKNANGVLSLPSASTGPRCEQVWIWCGSTVYPHLCQKLIQ
uniref:Titin n=1 Tax=Cyprinus carpio TaxID=7962 RepID=A0A8C1Q0I9_CYPCA